MSKTANELRSTLGEIKSRTELENCLKEVLEELKYQTKLLESLVENTEVNRKQSPNETFVEALSPILNSGLLPDGHPAKELLRNSLDKISKG